MVSSDDASSCEPAEPLMYQEGSVNKSDGNDSEWQTIQRVWRIIVGRARRSPIDGTNLVQTPASILFLIYTLLGVCHLGQSTVCFIEPYISNFIPLAIIQLMLNGTYLLWPDLPDLYARTKLPTVVWLLLGVGWLLELIVASLLMLEGLLLGSSYHYIHIPRFILSATELVCTGIITWQTFSIWQRVRGTKPHLPR